MNITLDSDDGEGINGMNVTMNSSTFRGYTVNGSVLFSVVPTGVHEITLSGDKTLVYFYGTEDLNGIIFSTTVTKADAGKVKQINYVLNETRALVNVTNSTYSAVPALSGLNVVITNGSRQYSGTTNSAGIVIFREVVPAVYTVTFNYTQLEDNGFIVPQSFTINVIAGNDENTTNNLTAPLQDIQVRFNITDEQSQGLDVYVALLTGDGQVANDSSGSPANGTTSGPPLGWLVLHTLVPSVTYNYMIDANSSGFGIWNSSQVYVPYYMVASVNRTLSPISIIVYAYDGESGQLKEDVNVSVLYEDAVAVNASDDALSVNLTGAANNVNFTHLFLYPLNYTVNVSSPRYFSEALDVSFGVMNPSETSETVQFSLTERKITVNIGNSTGDELEEGVNISIEDTGTGAVIQSLNGTFLNVSGTNASVTFLHVPDGEYRVNVTSSRYFSSSAVFTLGAENTTSGIDEFNFTMIERTVIVYLKDTDGSTLDHAVDVSVNQTDGSPITGTDSNIIPQQTGQTDTVTFNFIPDGENYKVIVASNDYFSQNWTFNTSDLPADNEHTFTMYERIAAVSVYDFADRTLLATAGNVTITLYNTTGVATNTTGDDLAANTTTGQWQFTGIRDETFNVSAVTGGYTQKNETFDPASGDSNSVGIYMKKLGHGYFNVTVYAEGTTTPISGATVSLRYLNASGTVVDTASVTGGYAMVEVNVSEYDQSDKNMTFVVSASGYYANSSVGYFNVSDQGVEAVVATLQAEPPPENPPSPGGRRTTTTGGVAPLLETQSFGNIEAGTSKSVKFLRSDLLNINEIAILTDEDAAGVSVTVKPSASPAGASEPIPSVDGKVYKYLDISAANLPDSAIKTVTVSFKVPRSWISDNGIDPEGIHMFRYSGISWRSLETAYLSTDGTWNYYRAVSPGFSTFAIAGYYLKEKDMEPTLLATYLKASECKTVYLTVKNTGGMTLTNVHVDALDAEWGTVAQSKGIASLGSGLQDRVTLRVCAGRDAVKGSYDISLDVISDQATRKVTSQVQVTETYLETLTKQIESLEAELDALEDGLDAEGMGYYNSARDRIADAREQLGKGNYDAALSSMNEARGYIDKIKEIEPKKGYLDMFIEWIILNYILTTVIAAMLIGMSSVVLLRKRIAGELPELPTGGEVLTGVMRAGEEAIDNLMSIIRELETRVEKIDFENLGDNERKWYNKVRLQIENIKRSVDGGEFKKAQRHANDAELYMKMLELHSAS